MVCGIIRAGAYVAQERLFTFVRDPIQHFLSAYKEIEYRHAEDAPFQAQFAAALGTEARVHEFLWRYLHEKYVHGAKKAQTYHTYLMSGLRHPKQDVKAVAVGRLEELDLHWRQVRLGLPLPPKPAQQPSPN